MTKGAQAYLGEAQAEDTCESWDTRSTLEAAEETHKKSGEAGDGSLPLGADDETPPGGSKKPTCQAQAEDTCESWDTRSTLEAVEETHKKTGEAGDGCLPLEADVETPPGGSKKPTCQAQAEDTCESWDTRSTLEAAEETHEKTGEAGDGSCRLARTTRPHQAAQKNLPAKPRLRTHVSPGIPDQLSKQWRKPTRKPARPATAACRWKPTSRPHQAAQKNLPAKPRLRTHVSPGIPDQLSKQRRKPTKKPARPATAPAGWRGRRDPTRRLKKTYLRSPG